MLKLILKIIAAIALLIASLWIFIHLLPWVIAIIGIGILAIKSYHAWLRKNGDKPPTWWPFWGKDSGGQPIA